MIDAMLKDTHTVRVVHKSLDQHPERWRICAERSGKNGLDVEATEKARELRGGLS